MKRIGQGKERKERKGTHDLDFEWSVGSTHVQTKEMNIFSLFFKHNKHMKVFTHRNEEESVQKKKEEERKNVEFVGRCWVKQMRHPSRLPFIPELLIFSLYDRHW
jgi:hypothetical protein